MAQKIVDLDALAGDPKQVKLRGHTYQLPPDLPVELWLRLQRQAAESSEDADDVDANQRAIEALYEQLLELFRDPLYGDPSIEELPIGMTQLITALGTIYGGDDAEEDPPPPTRSSRGGTRSTSAKRPPTRSR